MDETEKSLPLKCKTENESLSMTWLEAGRSTIHSFLSTFVPYGLLFDSNLSPVKIQINSTECVCGGGSEILREAEASSMKSTSYKNKNP